jgi:hypothetical protein
MADNNNFNYNEDEHLATEIYQNSCIRSTKSSYAYKMTYIFNYFHSKPEYQRYIVYNDQEIPVDLRTEYINNDRPIPRIPFMVFGHIAIDSVVCQYSIPLMGKS